MLELATRRPVALAAPSLHTRYGVQDRLDGWLAVGVSQSGRTPEIVSVLERFGAAGARTVAITNDRDSPLAQTADATIDTAAGAEQAVPATKTVTSQFAAFAVLAEALAATTAPACRGTTGVERAARRRRRAAGRRRARPRRRRRGRRLRARASS